MHETDTTATNQRQRLQPPKRYGVFLLNDDYTTMDFVVFVLREVFGLPEARAVAVMLEIHNNGRGLCGIYSYDIAHTKRHQVQELAQNHGHPLRAIVQEV